MAKQEAFRILPYSFFSLQDSFISVPRPYSELPGKAQKKLRSFDRCPGHVIPARLATFAQRGDMESFQKFDGMECCECGCCSYICPAKRPLTQSIKSMRKMVLASRKKK